MTCLSLSLGLLKLLKPWSAVWVLPISVSSDVVGRFLVLPCLLSHFSLSGSVVLGWVSGVGRCWLCCSPALAAVVAPTPVLLLRSGCTGSSLRRRDPLPRVGRLPSESALPEHDALLALLAAWPGACGGQLRGAGILHPF